jgi:hypothetical protein
MVHLLHQYSQPRQHDMRERQGHIVIIDMKVKNMTLTPRNRTTNTRHISTAGMIKITPINGQARPQERLQVILLTDGIGAIETEIRRTVDGGKILPLQDLVVLLQVYSEFYQKQLKDCNMFDLRLDV